MLAIDNTEGRYRFILRCDGCGKEIKDLRLANGDFVEKTAGELCLRGIFCKENCVHEILRSTDVWELHHVLELLSFNVKLRRKEGKSEVETLSRICL